MLYLLAVVLPPLAVLGAGKPGQAILNLLLWPLGIVPAIIHALFVVHGKHADGRTTKLIEAQQKSAQAQMAAMQAMSNQQLSATRMQLEMQAAQMQVAQMAQMQAAQMAQPVQTNYQFLTPTARVSPSPVIGAMPAAIVAAPRPAPASPITERADPKSKGIPGWYTGRQR